MNEKIDYIEVTLVLKNSQYKSLNNWQVTLAGEVRLATSNHVVFHVENLSQLSGIFNIDEVAEFHINWVNTHFTIDQGGNKIYF